jgi:hypothetical protein
MDYHCTWFFFHPCQKNYIVHESGWPLAGVKVIRKWSSKNSVLRGGWDFFTLSPKRENGLRKGRLSTEIWHSWWSTVVSSMFAQQFVIFISQATPKLWQLPTPTNEFLRNRQWQRTENQYTLAALKLFKFHTTLSCWLLPGSQIYSNKDSNSI